MAGLPKRALLYKEGGQTLYGSALGGRDPGNRLICLAHRTVRSSFALPHELTRYDSGRAFQASYGAECFIYYCIERPNVIYDEAERPVKPFLSFFHGTRRDSR